MSREEQKELEKKHVEYFFSLLDGSSNFKIIPYEKPDFLIKQSDNTIGLEHTQLFRRDEEGKPILKIIESIQDRIREKLRVEFETKVSIPIVISLAWHPEKPIKSKEVDSITDRIFQLVDDNIPEPGNSIRLDRSNKIPESLLSIFILHSKDLSKPNIFMSRSTWDSTVTIEHIEAIVDDKEQKKPLYDCRCDEFWLLIVAEGAAPSSIVSLGFDVTNYKFDTSFERLFYFDLANSKIYELNQHAV